jgi:23S rRNA (cytidine1920-2'-O)/16S rRNA (cytidine1409-2'-O)-methyltransferase
VIDVSFISLRLVLATAFGALRDGGDVVALFKPQFEAARNEVPRGGVIRDAKLHSILIGRFTASCVRDGIRIVDMMKSPILGAEGNTEFLFHLKAGKP